LAPCSNQIGFLIPSLNRTRTTSPPGYSDGAVALSGLRLTPGAHYRLVGLPAVADVGGRHTASEYDLDLIGPASAATARGATVWPSPSPSPSPAD
jgi:hypothetical protein